MDLAASGTAVVEHIPLSSEALDGTVVVPALGIAAVVIDDYATIGVRS